MAPPINSGDFGCRQGSGLTIGDKPFRFNGNNLYFNQADISYGRTTGVEEALDKMAVWSMTVTRSNAHNDNVQAAILRRFNLSPMFTQRPAWWRLIAPIAGFETTCAG